MASDLGRTRMDTTRNSATPDDSLVPRRVRPLGVPAAWTGAESIRVYPAARLDQLVARQAERTPEAIALSDGPTTVSYAQLMRDAHRLAHVLCARGIDREDLVAVSLDRSIDQIVSVLGVLLSGAAFVPIDPQGPAERRRFMLEDAQPRAIVTNAASAGSIPSELRRIVVSSASFGQAHAEPGAGSAPLPLTGTPQDLAYAIYTSGSTGTPKGVLNQHDGVSNHLAWMAETFPLSTDDRVLVKAPAVFDVAVWEWFWPLSQGACLVLAPPGTDKDPRSLLDAIEAHQITNIHFVPTLLRVLLERPDLDRCRSLQRVFCSGEAVAADLRDRFFDRVPGRPVLIDLYGPTEAAVHVTAWVCTPGETGPVPIGHPLPNVRAYIVDHDLNPVPEGVRGELLIGGVQVARGYLRRPELTREQFVPDPFVEDPDARCYRTGDCVAWRADGAIDFFGRYDSQVKLGGVRVELGEVEAALRLHPAVGDAAAVVREDGESKRIVAYLRRAHAGDTRPDPTVESLRRFLADRLPAYMTPGWYVWLDRFPATPTGKLDRRALPNPDASRLSTERAFEPPVAGTEAHLAKLWRDELKIDQVGRHDDFHLLGGDSLGAMRLFERIRDTFGVDLPLATLFEARTVAELAVLLRDRIEGSTPPESGDRTRLETGVPAITRPALRSLVAVQNGAGRTPLFVVHGAGGNVLNIWDLARAMSPKQAVFGLQASGIDGVSPPGATIEQMAQTYLDEVRAVQPQGPYMLAGYSGGGVIAFEMARRLDEAGEAIGVLAFIDTFHPQMRLPQINALTRLERLRREGMPYVRDAFDRLRKSRQDARDERRLEEHLAAGEPIPLALRELYLIRNFQHAARRYTPPAWPGKVLLFRAEQVDYYYRAGGPVYGWDETVLGGIEIIPIPGDHDTLLLGANAQRIAHRLGQAIDEVEARGAIRTGRDRRSGAPERTAD